MGINIVKVGGQEHIEKGIPVVVLEAGFGSPLMSWDTIFNDVAKIAPVMAYERSGIGQSEWNQMEYSPINVVQLLRKILTKLELPPPYVLAGHSWGEFLLEHMPDISRMK
jgi:pimeloyl-ACP methyl ester carboxylesterase